MFLVIVADLDEELWERDYLAIPVYHTEDGRFSSIRSFSFLGSDLRSHDGSITRSLCNQIFTQTIHWARATNFPDSAAMLLTLDPVA